MLPPGTSPGEGSRLLWGALAFAAGITTGVYAWRPPLWWVVAWIVFALSGAYLLRRRGRPAFIVGLGALFFLGALMVQVRGPNDAGNAGGLAICRRDRGYSHRSCHQGRNCAGRSAPGSFQAEDRGRDRTDRQGTARALRSIPACASTSTTTSEEGGQAGSRRSGHSHFRYGERLRFPAKISPPRNYRNPGAFDYRGYLAENGIVALASTKAASVEVLPGFAGSRAELWRSRIHRSIIEKSTRLWPAARSRADGCHGDWRRRVHQPARPAPTSSARAPITCWWFRG